MVKLFCNRTKITAKIKLNVLFLTYYSLTKFTTKKVGSSEVARQLNLPQTTVSTLVNRFQSLGCDVSCFLVRGKSPGRPREPLGNPNIEKKLISTLYLRNWAHLSLQQRCLIIEKRFKIKVNTKRLKIFYQRNNICRKPISKNYYPHDKDLKLLQAERIEFAKKLYDYIKEGTPIVYFDETSMNCQLQQSKAWYHRSQNFCVPVAQHREAGFTVYGAIGDCLQDHAYFEIHDSTNMYDTTEYMKNLKKQLKPQKKGVRPVLVLDNHSAHKGDRIELMEQFCKVEFIPTYSSQLNSPIEFTWSVLKRRCLPLFTKLSLEHKCTRAKCIKIVKEQVKQIDKEVYKNLLRAHYPTIQELLVGEKPEYLYPLT